MARMILTDAQWARIEEHLPGRDGLPGRSGLDDRRFVGAMLWLARTASPWRDLPPDAPVFLLTGDYNLSSLPDHMDFSSSVIPYTKAVEVVLDRLVFQPFRASSYTDQDCHNKFLQAFMRGEKSLTLGSYMIILSSSKETALRSTMQYTIPDVDGFVAVLTDEAMRDVRNKAAHDEVLSRDEARQARAWAVGILGMV